MEVETNVVLIAIYLMNCDLERCSCNTLSAYLSKVHRIPNKKKHCWQHYASLKQEGVIRKIGKGPGTKIHLTMDGNLYLMRLEDKVRL
jgi:hypothetical protein